jgi:hypothetical protein
MTARLVGRDVRGHVPTIRTGAPRVRRIHLCELSTQTKR